MPSPDAFPKKERHCQPGFIPQGWPLAHADLVN